MMIDVTKPSNSSNKPSSMASTCYAIVIGAPTNVYRKKKSTTFFNF